MGRAAFFPQAVYAPDEGQPAPRVLISPPKYVQGPGVLNHAGRYLDLLRLKRVGLLASRRGHGAEGARMSAGLEKAGIQCVPVTFAGECSFEEIEAATEQLSAAAVDALVAVGGGKCVDAGKCVAYRLGVPVIIVPTLASNDAPCSAVAVIYTPEGVVTSAEFFPDNPAIVIVDTEVVASAPERYLVAGMGDAMATWYEARVCIENPRGLNILGARPSLAACAMGEVCAATLFADGEAAGRAVRENRVDDALERVVEANTLLSGIGFESGGLAGAHGLAEGYTTLPEVERNFLHGEMVGMGVLTQLMMQDEEAEARRVAEFFARIGLPVHLGQLNLSPDDTEALNSVAEGAMNFAPIHNLPGEVNAERVYRAIIDADTMGRSVAADVGDEAYQRVQAGD